MENTTEINEKKIELESWNWDYKNTHAYKVEKEKQEYLEELNKKWREYISEKLDTPNLEYVLEFTDEARQFMKDLVIDDVYWTENYHWGPQAKFLMAVTYNGEHYAIKGAWGDYSFPLLDDKYVFFDSARADELFAEILVEFGLHDALMKLDGANWEPSTGVSEGDEWDDTPYNGDDEEPIECQIGDSCLIYIGSYNEEDDLPF